MARFFLTGFIVFLLPAISFAGPKPDLLQLKPQTIALSALPVSFKRSADEQKIFGSLIFRNGYALSSASPYWGGLSGLTISKRGDKLLAVSDAGVWALLNLNYKKNRLLAPTKARIGPLKALKNRKLKRQKDRDAEAITLLKSDKFFGPALISFEINHRIGRFQMTKTGLKGPHSYLKLRSITSRLKGNAGLEALSVLQGGKLKGALIAIAQSKQDKHKNFIGWMVHKGKISKLRFTPPPLDTYRITDAASLPNGDLLLLERRYKFLTINIRVRHVRQAELLSRKSIRGRVVLTANSHQHRVDNMEGIAVHSNKHGETLVTLISDDNFNGFQNTYLMQFALPRNWRVAWK